MRLYVLLMQPCYLERVELLLPLRHHALELLLVGRTLLAQPLCLEVERRPIGVPVKEGMCMCGQRRREVREMR